MAHFRRAIELDPYFAPAYGMAARCYAIRRATGWVSDHALETAEAARLVRLATEFGRDDAVALSTAGIATAFVLRDLAGAAELLDRSLELNPSLAWAWLSSGWVKVWLGEPEAAIGCVNRALRLSPHDTQRFNMRTAMASAHFVAGRYAEALSWAVMALREKPEFTLASCAAAASAALAGRQVEAEQALTVMRQREPSLAISSLAEWLPCKRPQDLERWAEGLRKAGLPE